MSDGLKPCQFRTVDNSGRILCGLIKGGDREVSVNLCRVCPVQQINCQNLRATLDKKTSTPITVRFATGRVEVWDNDPPTIDFKQAACAAKTMPINSPRDCAGCPIRLPNIIPQNAIQVAHHAKQNAPASPIPPILANNASAPVASAPRAAQPSRARANTVARAQAQAASPESVPMALPPVADPNPAADLIAQAQATAARKDRERAAARLAESNALPTENKSKIILLQQWVADQFNRKQAAQQGAQPVAPQPDEYGVSEITYAPLAPVYREEADYERCVGWTD